MAFTKLYIHFLINSSLYPPNFVNVSSIILKIRQFQVNVVLNNSTHIFWSLLESTGIIKKWKEFYLRKKRWYSLCYYISMLLIRNLLDNQTAQIQPIGYDQRDINILTMLLIASLVLMIFEHFLWTAQRGNNSKMNSF